MQLRRGVGQARHGEGRLDLNCRELGRKSFHCVGPQVRDGSRNRRFVLKMFLGHDQEWVGGWARAQEGACSPQPWDVCVRYRSPSCITPKAQRLLFSVTRAYVFSVRFMSIQDVATYVKARSWLMKFKNILTFLEFHKIKPLPLTTYE